VPPQACPTRHRVVRVHTSLIQGQCVQTLLFKVCGTICNDVVRLHALADRSGNHGQSSQCTGGRPCHQDSDAERPALCVPSAPKPANFPAGACFSVGRRSCTTSLLPSRAVQPSLAYRKSKLMSGPVTSWPERVAGRDPRPTFDINQTVPCVGNVLPSVYRPCVMIICHRKFTLVA
jgi:hypothetical protein